MGGMMDSMTPLACLGRFGMSYGTAIEKDERKNHSGAA